MTPNTYAVPVGRPVALSRSAAFRADGLMLADGAPVEPAPFRRDGDYAVVTVRGALEQHADNAGLCDNYEAVLARCRAAFDSDAPKVAIVLRSPGGDFAGSIETARLLRAKADATGKPFCAFTDKICASAAMGLACAADEIIATPSALVGSVGVWAARLDVTKLDAAMGQRIVIVASGDRKTDGNPHQPVSEGAIDALQAQVDAMAAQFFAWVSERRGLSIDAVAALQGAEFFGERAVAAGLVDALATSFADVAVLRPAGERGKLKGSATFAASSFSSEHNDMPTLRESLAKYAESEDKDESEKAKKFLKSYDNGEPKGEEPADDKEKKDKEDADAKARAESEDKAKKAKAEKDEADAKARAEADEKKDGEASAKALAAVASMQARLDASEAKLAAKEDADKRAALFASRNDLSAEVRAFVETLPTDKIEAALKALPRGRASASSVVVPNATQGARDAAPDLSDPEIAYIDRHMRFPKASGAVVNSGSHLELGAMTPEQAEARLKQLAANGGN